MLRFLPDSWLEGLMRPLLMADPAVGLYYEEAAPDWRFAALIVLVGVGVASRHQRLGFTREHWRLLLALMVTFYVWTFLVGNGRYFVTGLIIVGPLLVLAWQRLPGTRGFRWLSLACFVALQGWTVASMYRPGAWALARWVDGPALSIAASPLREAPAIFLTVTSNSFAALATQFHPESRWVNITGQTDLSPQRPEYSQFRRLLESSLPRYVLAPALQRPDGPMPQPDRAAWDFIDHALTAQGLEASGRECQLVATGLWPHDVPANRHRPGAFWICPVRAATTGAAAPSIGGATQDMDAVFERMEAHCPRFFPPGRALSKRYADHWVRYYPTTDTRLYVENTGYVTYKYYRAFAPSVAGTVDEVRQGRIDLDCTRLPGRYLPPWKRD